MGKTINVYDYVNHPYQAVRDKLTADASEVFRSATKVAAMRAKTVASELHVNIAGIEIGTDIAISVKSVEEQPKQAMSSPMTRIQLEWEAAKMPGLFPFMKGELSIYPLTSTETQLYLSGNYEPPLGVLGSLIDAVVGNRIAEASVHQFITDVAVYLRKELADSK
ncbi:MAG TPA: hypothetical protein PKY82_21980, partial [Pyrinomonadaceae bacterium]|nr:hypothetical protein [Pyrinomonadaceae bacterium]